MKLRKDLEAEDLETLQEIEEKLRDREPSLWKLTADFSTGAFFTNNVNSVSKNRLKEDTDTRVSVGIEFPFGKTTGDGYFKSTKTTIDAVKNNIRLLLQTHRGERVFQPNLGMNLRSLIFEKNKLLSKEVLFNNKFRLNNLKF